MGATASDDVFDAKIASAWPAPQIGVLCLMEASSTMASTIKSHRDGVYSRSVAQARQRRPPPGRRSPGF